MPPTSSFGTGPTASPAGTSTSALFACIRGVGEAAALEGAFRLCATLTPRIERHPKAGALALDLGGSERLLLVEAPYAATAEAEASWPALAERLATRLRADVPDLSRGVHVGIGPTQTVAWLAATIASVGDDPWRAVLPAQVADFLAPLPLALLGDIPDLAGMPELVPALEALALSGIGTLGQVRRVTPLALQQRFGPFGASIATVAAGHDLRPLRVEHPDEWTGIRLRCEPALRTEQLPLALEPLAEQVALALHERQQMAGAIALLLYPEVGESVQNVQELSHPLASASALLDQARRMLERLVPAAATGAHAEATYHGVHGLQAAAPQSASAPRWVRSLQRVHRRGHAARTRAVQRDSACRGPRAARDQPHRP